MLTGKFSFLISAGRALSPVAAFSYLCLNGAVTQSSELLTGGFSTGFLSSVAALVVKEHSPTSFSFKALLCAIDKRERPNETLIVEAVLGASVRLVSAPLEPVALKVRCVRLPLGVTNDFFD